jgi:hypothetical protein
MFSKSNFCFYFFCRLSDRAMKTINEQRSKKILTVYSGESKNHLSKPCRLETLRSQLVNRIIKLVSTGHSNIQSTYQFDGCVRTSAAPPSSKENKGSALTRSGDLCTGNAEQVKVAYN